MFEIKNNIDVKLYL